MLSNNFITSDFGVKMPKIIYGTAWKKQQTADLVKLAIEQGFRGIDTACQPKHYNEAGVGEGVSHFLQQGSPRSELYIQTKFTPIDGQDPAQVPYDKKASLTDQVRQSFLQSLSNLNIAYLDGLVLHSPLADPKALKTVWQALEAVFNDQGVRQLGISNCYNLEQLEFIFQQATIKPAVLQNRFYQQSNYDKDIRIFCQKNAIIYQSFWSLTANPKILASKTVLSLAERYQKTPEQVFLRYLTHIDIVPLTGTSSVKHMQEDLAVFEFELQAKEIADIDSCLF